MQNACIMTTKKTKLFQHYWLKHFNKQLSCMERKKWNFIVSDTISPNATWYRYDLLNYLCNFIFEKLYLNNHF